MKSQNKEPSLALAKPAEPVSIIIELSGVPVGKGRPRFVRSTGVAFTPAKTRTYESHLRLAAQDAMVTRAPIEGPVHVTMIARLPIPKSWSKNKIAEARLGLHCPVTKPDVDNYLKLLDALNHVVFRDDSQIVEATVKKIYSEKPALLIEIKEIGRRSFRSEELVMFEERQA